MGWSIRKSFSILSGLRLNLSKGGPRLSIGMRGARLSVGSDGKARVYGSAGPLRYQKSLDTTGEKQGVGFLNLLRSWLR
jgi:hypothetical protein